MILAKKENLLYIGRRCSAVDENEEDKRKKKKKNQKQKQYTCNVAWYWITN